MVHFRIVPEDLQPLVPIPLDTREGWAYLSLVAFEQADFRPRLGGRIARWLAVPAGCHHFLNLRTYVHLAGERGIYFLAEWVPNRLATLLGPRLYGLPYRFGRLDYRFSGETGTMSGEVEGPGAIGGSPLLRQSWSSTIGKEVRFERADEGSLSEFLMERYTAFTERCRVRRLFRIWHRPWLQAPVEIELRERSLFEARLPSLRGAATVAANYSPGLKDVRIGRPRRLCLAAGIG